MIIKNYLLLLVLVCLFTQYTSLNNAISGKFKDERDGQTYKWVRLKDGKKWMAQNLNYQMANAWCYDKEASNCAVYGRLYNWDAAMKACPKGWRLPSDEEWWAMTSYYGKAFNAEDGQEENYQYDAGKQAYESLIEGGDSGFSALFGGYRHPNGEYALLDDNGYYWSSANAWNYCFRYNQTLNRYLTNKSFGSSCRCIQD